MIEITVTCEDQEPDARHFDGSRIRIGRSDDNDLVLSSSACSRYHAELIREGETYTLKDLGSANGIRYRSQLVSELTLLDGMRVELGLHTLSFAIPARAQDQTVLLSDLDRQHGPPSVAPAPEPSVLFLVYKRHGQVQSLKVVQGIEYTIGRAPDADLIIDDKQSSKYHAKIVWKGNQVRVRDCNSSNGTRVGGRRVDEAPLVPGSQIVIGTTVITAQQDTADLSDDAAVVGRTMLGFPPEKHGWSRRSVVAGVGALVFGVAGVFVWLGGWSGAEEDGEGNVLVTTSDSAVGPNDELIVQVASVVARDLVRSVDGTAVIRPRRRVTVSAEVAGRIVALPVQEGARVEQGQILAQVDDRDIRLQIEEARSAVSEDRVNLAREDYERKQRLFDDGVTTRSIVDQARQQYLSLDSAFKSTQATVQRLEEELRKTRIAAPMSGRVASRPVNQGEFLAPGMPVVELEDMDEVLVEVDLPDRDVVNVETGQAVEVTLDAFPGLVIPGLVDNIASVAHPVTRTFKVEARIENHDGRLRSGMMATLRIVLEKSRELVVPIEALLDRREGEADVVVVTEGTAHRVTVRLGGEFDRQVEVLEGLSEGDDIVVYGLERIRDGQRIDSYRRQ